ncbi:Disease resistance protein RGA2 [Rhynchospora pubera]|uniref:Disease resistance protein RGA2 n=1 Tax=Rhynchospora pubera TaxID=906938 RepID=A0AAV8H361_9POAL|nr:Disease resistance protein RGA2 [Rhynchospora pubera]
MASWVTSIIQELAGWVGAAAVQKIVDMGIDLYMSKRMQIVDSEAAVKRVQMALPQIQAVMCVAEALKMEDPSSREWVQQFREAVDAAEDVLDELEYKKLEDMVQNRDDKVGGSSSDSKKRRTCVTSGDILERLKKAVIMLDEATAGVEDLLQRADKLGISYLSKSQLEYRTNLRRQTTSFVTERKVFGREDEKARIICWLTRQTEAPLSSFGIVGVGGLGKTTVAQSVYQELDKSGYFEKTIWVCVSTEFSVEGITANILETNCHSDTPLDVLQQSLKEKILSKKILLVLDDIWEDEKKRDWEQLIAPLRFVQKGSQILFTTRKKSAADLLANVINTEHERLTLKDLEEPEMRLLFNSIAFDGLNPNEYGDLQAIGDHIIKKLHGNPLAAKAVGGLLNSHMDLLYWRRISNHGSLINLEQANDVMEVLKLSYYNLPTDLQVCFRFCSIFPQDYEFDKEDLIKMWMASGFIRKQSCEEIRPEDIGENYFNLLLRKSFFETYKLWRGERYIIHDLMHELAKNISIGECCRVARDEKSVVIPSTVQHVSVHVSEIQKVSHLENIRSLIITTSEPKDETNPDLFVLPYNLVKKSLRLLKICAIFSSKLPEEMSYLVHLRYLSIELKPPVRESFKYLLPPSIYKLYHLIVLEYNGKYPKSSYSGIETTGMTNLVNLRYMRLPDQIMKTICGVHRLTSLQELTFFVGHESGYCINELRTLNNLRSLTVHNIENIENPAEARSANLLAKEYLQSLSLICTSESTLDNHEQIFDNLQPHQNLMELVIKNYKGQKSPIWIRNSFPPNLSSIELWKCPYLNEQPIFGQIPHLRILKIYECPNIDKLPDIPLSLTEFLVYDVGLISLPNFYQRFGSNTPTPLSEKSLLTSVDIIKCPTIISLNGFLLPGTQDLCRLENLRIEQCDNLAELPMHALRTFVSLNQLHISDCPNLTVFPCLPLHLIYLSIDGMAISALPNFFERPGSDGGPSPSSLTSSLGTVRISNCPNITALNGFLQQDNIDFRALYLLRIDKCENLVRIPKGAFRKFVSLTSLFITDCPKLAVVDNQNNLLPSKLIKLFMQNCGELEVPLLQSAFGVSTLTDLVMQECANITPIPSSEHVFRSLNNKPINGDQERNMSSVNINYLSIDQLSLLLVEPLRSLRSVRILSVEDCSGMEALPEQWMLQNSSTLKKLTIWKASTLQSLPASLMRLTALEELWIDQADLLVEHPKLPATLKKWTICSSYGANKFK